MSQERLEISLECGHRGKPLRSYALSPSPLRPKPPPCHACVTIGQLAALLGTLQGPKRDLKKRDQCSTLIILISPQYTEVAYPR